MSKLSASIGRKNGVLLCLAGALVGYVLTSVPAISYLLPIAAAYAIGYATLLSLFSASVGEDRQGWVMGITTALWTLGAGLTSVISGDVMGLDIRLPFYMAAGSAGLTCVLILLLWQAPGVREIAREPPS